MDPLTVEIPLRYALESGPVHCVEWLQWVNSANARGHLAP